MTEPLLFGTTFLAVGLVARWATTVEHHDAFEPPVAGPVREQPHPSSAAHAPVTGEAPARLAERPVRGDPHDALDRSGGAARLTTLPGWALVAACLTRYEAWPIAAAAIGLAFAVLLRRGWGAAEAFRAVRGLALWPLWAIAAFLVNSKVTVGAFFISSGFFVPENPSLGHPWLAWMDIWKGLIELTGRPLPWAAAAAAIVIAWRFVRRRDAAGGILVLALAACAALPWAAYYKGHPVRLRYDVPLVAAAAAIAGMGIALLPRRARAIAGVALIAIAAWDAEPFDQRAPVVVESQREAPNMIARRAVTGYLQAHWDGEPIMMSMGSLGHYMHDLSRAGFNVRDFLHEGNGEIWKAAFAHPRPYVEWLLVEEKAEGGDALYWQGKLDPRFFAGYDRVAAGGNVALYRRHQ